MNKKIKLSIDDKNKAVKYVEASGFYKNRLAKFLGISRPTLDRILDDNDGFFTRLKAADAKFCKELIEKVKKRKPEFLLKTKYKEEFDDTIKFQSFDPEEEIQRVKKLIDNSVNN